MAYRPTHDVILISADFYALLPGPADADLLGVIRYDSEVHGQAHATALGLPPAFVKDFVKPAWEKLRRQLVGYAVLVDPAVHGYVSPNDRHVYHFLNADGHHREMFLVGDVNIPAGWVAGTPIVVIGMPHAGAVLAVWVKYVNHKTTFVSEARISLHALRDSRQGFQGFLGSAPLPLAAGTAHRLGTFIDFHCLATVASSF